MQVLLVEDQPQLAQLMAQGLSEAGFAVESRGPTAWRRSASWKAPNTTWSFYVYAAGLERPGNCSRRFGTRARRRRRS